VKYEAALCNIHALTKSTSIYIISNSLAILHPGYSICSDRTYFVFIFSFYDNFYKAALENTMLVHSKASAILRFKK